MTYSVRKAYRIAIIVMVAVTACLTYGWFVESNAETATKIYTAEDLYAINSNMDGNYILMNDIDLSSATAQGGDWDFMGNGWEPIGSQGKYGNDAFTGTLDGNGYAIQGLRIDVSSIPNGAGDTIYSGLFANNQGTICNLFVYESSLNASIESHNLFAGVIAGANHGDIYNCFVEADIDIVNENTDKATSSQYIKTDYNTIVGGIVGYSYNGTIRLSSYSGNMMIYTSGTNTMMYGWALSTVRQGGIVGVSKGSIEKCYSNTNIVGRGKSQIYGDPGSNRPDKVNTYYQGGISGSSELGTITSSYSIGDIQFEAIQYTEYSTAYSGGIVGSANTIINGCYYYGDVLSGLGYAISGILREDANISDCFYKSGGAQSQGGSSALTTGQFKTKSCFTNYDFDNTWLIDVDSDYLCPQLKGNRQDNKDIELVEIATEPTTKEYYAGSEIKPTGGAVKIYYKDGSRETKDITAAMLRDYDMDILGEQDVTVNYRDFTDTYKITVVERPEIETMTLLSGPDKTEFVKGTAFDFTGCQVKVDYANGNSEIIDVTADATEGGNINRLGNQTITYTLLDKSVEFTVKVIPVEIESIEVESLPDQTVFVEGKAINTSGLKIKAIYNNGEEHLINDYTLSELPTSIGKHSIEVTYSGCTTSFEVEIIEKSAVSIAVKNDPDKTTYVIGQEFDPTGMVIEATFDNDDVLEITDYSIGDLPDTVGTGRVEIEYQGKKAYVSVSMIERVVESISVQQLPDKVRYIQDEDFDPTGLKIVENYNNGKSSEITDYTLHNTSTAKAGTKTITVMYDGFTTTFDITVVEKNVIGLTVTPPTTTSYIQGESFDRTGMIVEVKYDNGKSEVVEDYTISGFGEGDEETNVITVAYKGVSRSFIVTIHVPEDEWRIVTQATCTTDGEQELYCKECNELLKTETITATGHSWSAWETVSSPNCTDKGSEKRTCANCNEVEYKDVDPKGHTWDTDYTVDRPASCSEEGSESQHCSVCGIPNEESRRSIEKLDHTYGNWTIAKDPTCTEKGHEERACSSCGHIDTRDIAAIGHMWNPAMYIWSVDNTTVTATRTCMNDNSHFEAETVKTTSAITKAATYTSKGQTTYTAAFTNNAFATQIKTVTDIPKKPKEVNPMTVAAKKPVVKYAKLKKKTQTIKVKAAFTVKNAKGTVTYKKTSGVKKITVSKAGKITIKKGMKKGKYKVKVKVTATGTTVYKAKNKVVTVTIKVK